MDLVLALKYLHVIGATILLGTGLGIAFFMLRAHRSGDAGIIAHVSGSVVVADLVFTATAVVVQPITGFLLARMTGYDFSERWILVSLGLYLIVGLFWLPVVFIQMRIGALAREALMSGQPLPPAYYRLFAIWFAFGWPAFAAVLAIFWLMIARPAIG
jgi:uncharacterized membrane protein